MKDWYLRIVLTIIAICLVAQVAESFKPEPAVAASDVIEVKIVDIDWNLDDSHSLPVKIVGIDKYRDREWDDLPVSSQ